MKVVRWGGEIKKGGYRGVRRRARSEMVDPEGWICGKCGIVELEEIIRPIYILDEYGKIHLNVIGCDKVICLRENENL